MESCHSSSSSSSDGGSSIGGSSNQPWQRLRQQRQQKLQRQQRRQQQHAFTPPPLMLKASTEDQGNRGWSATVALSERETIHYFVLLLTDTKQSIRALQQVMLQPLPLHHAPTKRESKRYWLLLQLQPRHPPPWGRRSPSQGGGACSRFPQPPGAAAGSPAAFAGCARPRWR